MYRYYVEKKFNPTYARLDGEDRLAGYMRQRCAMLQDKLALPVRMFEGLEVLEFGPAGGENALVWAKLGADVYLVEPVAEFGGTIREYFGRYGLSGKLKLLAQKTFSDFISEKLFDMVVAEGFVYTTGPAKWWTKQLVKFCGEGGFVMLSMPEAGGFLVELLQSRICRIAAARHKIDRIAAAEMIVGEKWNRIAHSRSFESWSNDVLYNPYAAYESLNHSGDILQLMYEWGCDLYSSWPVLRKEKDVSWIKARVSRREKLAQQKEAALKLLPSMLMGETVELEKNTPREYYERLLGLIKKELRALSDLEETATQEGVAEVLGRHRESAGLLNKIVADYEGSRLGGLMKEIERCLASFDDEPARMAERFGGGKILGEVWGSPNQYLVFQNTGNNEL